MRLLVATNNEGKAREFRRLLGDDSDSGGKGRKWEILSLADLEGLWRTETIGGLPPVCGNEAEKRLCVDERYAVLREKMLETGSTFEENAIIKALGAASYTGMYTLADDSGLEVDWLYGAPGVYSARYAGVDGDEKACNGLLILNMKDAPPDKRGAAYKVVLALASPTRALHTTVGVCEGSIGYTPKGDGGFGYDPLFVLPDRGLTMAELSMEEKNKISHRGKALRLMKEYLDKIEDLD